MGHTYCIDGVCGTAYCYWNHVLLFYWSIDGVCGTAYCSWTHVLHLSFFIT